MVSIEFNKALKEKDHFEHQFGHSQFGNKDYAVVAVVVKTAAIKSNKS